ncbi:hypothetical protein BJ741DRAFT_623726 [Chytriomyces cf. hyalinus JEL632]|nr:hypothetical protein BJ741DRAFT_623726 [Chytriomyces cf. hyalinus JEL632]
MNSLVVDSKPGARCPSVTCYLCGREFGTASIGIHEPKCIERWEKTQAALPKDQRRPRPQKPQAISPSSTAKSPAELEAYNAAAQAAYLDTARAECQNCGRKFAQDRLEIHLRSCKPGGFFARKMEQRAMTAAAEPKPEPNLTEPPLSAKQRIPQEPGSSTKQSLNPIKRPPPPPTTQPVRTKCSPSPHASNKSLNMIPAISNPTASDALQQAKAAPLRPISGKKGIANVYNAEISVTGKIAQTTSRPGTVRKTSSASPGASLGDVSAAGPFCSECGARNDGGWKFCSSCGVKRAL